MAELLLAELRFPIYAVDARMSVAYANPAGHEFLIAQHILRLQAGRLLCPSTKDHHKLTKVVREALREGGVSSFLKDGADSLALCARRLADDTALLLVAHSAGHASPSASVIGRMLNLTPAEARLAQALARGMTLNGYARKASISVSTARSQLRHTFAKLGIRRQHDLLKRLHYLAVLRDGQFGLTREDSWRPGRE